jgi:hypothetical protein
MLLLKLILLIDVTFSTPTSDFASLKILCEPAAWPRTSLELGLLVLVAGRPLNGRAFPTFSGTDRAQALLRPSLSFEVYEESVNAEEEERYSNCAKKNQKSSESHDTTERTETYIGLG